VRAPARLVLLVTALLAASGGRADVLHLAGGGVIKADHWWIDGETLHVESAGGQIGLPRTMLVRVERTDSPGTLPVPRPAPMPAPAPAAGRVGSEVAAKMREANAALAARNFDKAAMRYYEVLSAEPDPPGPRVGYAAAEMARGRDAMALPIILDGLTKHPDDPDLLEVLGVLRDRDERVEEALAAWHQAFRVAPTDRLRDRIVKAERELEAGRDYATSAAAHFNVRYDGAVDQDVVASIVDFLEDRYGALTQQYRHAPSQPITVLLYPQQAFRDVTQAGREVAGLYDGKIRVPLAGLKRLDADAERVLTHELTHAIVQSKTRGNCPRWLHEGLAQAAEPRAVRRADAIQLARTVRAGDPATFPDAAFSYPAALSLTKYLESRRGFDLLVEVLARLGDGDTPEQAFEALYGATYVELAAQWAESLSGERTE